MKKKWIRDAIYNGVKTKTWKIMRLSAFFLFLFLSQVWAGSGYSQLTKLTLKMENARVVDVLDEIENNSEFYFLFNQKLVDVERKVDVDAKKKSIDDILNEMFSGTDVHHQVKDRLIILTTEKTDFDAETILQQQKFISGKVTDQSGEPLPGVTVVIKNTIQGTVTNADGNYSIANIPENATLVFSFVGMKTKEVPVGNQTNIDVAMEFESIGIEEVVAVGYGTQKKVNLTGAISVVSADVLENRPISSTGEGLQGIIPNLNISFKDGNPVNRGVDYNIRGFESINGGSPYILVDGVPMDIEDINPNDIESISVLKDASASAIYGGKAAFGVILVTTKRSKGKDKFTIKYSHETALSKPILKGYDIVDNSYTDTYYRNLMNINDGQAPINAVLIDGRKAYYENPGNAPEYEIVNGQFYYYGYTNWREEALRDFAPSYKHNLSIAGGTKKSNYYVSFGNFKKEGIEKYGTEVYNRNNILVKLDQELTDWLSLDQKVAVNVKNTEVPHRYPGQKSPAMRDILQASVGSPITFPENDPDFPELGGSYFENEIAYLSQTHTDVDQSYDTWLTSGMSIKPFKGIKIRSELSYHYSNSGKESAAFLINFVKSGGLGSGNNFDTGSTTPSTVSSQSGFSKGYLLNTYAEYELNDIGVHYMKAMVGFNQEENEHSSIGVTGYNMITSYVPSVNATTGDHIGGASASHSSLRGAFYRLNYIYNDKYLLELSGRYDGTSRFPKEDRFGFFPSGSVGWRLSEENFMKGIEQINNIKIRASYGELGNQSIRYEGESLLYPYVSSLGIETARWFLLDETNTFPTYTTMPELVSSTLTWETVATKNIGLDFTLLDQRMDGSFDLYTRETKDMLMRKKYPEIIGGTPPLENGADLKTKGWEFSLGWRDKINRNFNYNIRFSMWDYQTEITKFYNPTGSLAPDTYHEGMTIGDIWGYETYGLFQSQGEIDNAPDQTTINVGGADKWYPGDVRYVDQATVDTDGEGIPDVGDGKINTGNNTLDDHGDLVIIGNNTARYNYSFTFDLNYKNWALTAFFTGVGKRDYYPLVNGKFWPWATQPLNPEVINDYWTEDNRDAYWYRPTIYANKNHETQTRYLQDGSYVRLKSLILRYSLPTRFIGKAGLSRADIFISGQNLWEHSNIKYNRDPEHNTGNNLSDTRTDEITISYPFQRTFSLGVNLTF